MATSGNSGWAALRQSARSLETQTETAFHTYSQFAHVPNIPQKPTADELSTESKIESLLEKRETVIAQLSRLLDSDSSLTSSSLKQNNLQLLRDKLSDHHREYSRLRANIQHARARANLLSDVRNDIDQYRAQNPEQAEAEYMLDERNRIDNSHNVADSVLSQAYSVRDDFIIQNQTLQNVGQRISHAASQVPGLNTLMARISARKRRDSIIMGTFIAFCFLMFWWFS